MIRPQDGEMVNVPVSYGRWGWNRRLSLAGKVFYLIRLRETSASDKGPRWSLNLHQLAKRYGVSPWFVSQGVTALRRANLLENGLYGPEAWARDLEKLVQKYGPSRVERAQLAAALVYEDHYLYGIEQLILLEEKYGAERVQRAMKILGAKNPDNPRRTIGYLIKTIQGLNRGRWIIHSFPIHDIKGEKKWPTEVF